MKHRVSKHSKLSFERCPVVLRKTDMANWLIWLRADMAALISKKTKTKNNNEGNDCRLFWSPWVVQILIAVGYLSWPNMYMFVKNLTPDKVCNPTPILNAPFMCLNSCFTIKTMSCRTRNALWWYLHSLPSGSTVV